MLEKKLLSWIRESIRSELLRKRELLKDSWLLKVLPFEKDRVRYDSCSCMGLGYNRGLLTQCEKKKKEDEQYCRGCKVSLIGTVEERIASGLYSYKDRKGHKAQQYSDVLKKMNRSVEEVKLEATRLGIKISEEHLKEKVLSRGRPKKEKIQKEERKDLFARVYLDEVYEDDVYEDDVKNNDVKNNDVKNNDVKNNDVKYVRLTEEERLSRKCLLDLKREEKMKARL